ncbi:MAG: hypothetical protein AB7E47_00055 [Desulfovibrionaceae bacterium]
MGKVSSGWVLGAILSVMTCLVLGLTVVWFNIERMDMAYGLKKLQVSRQEGEDLVAKLRVERDTLLAPARLRMKAREYGLGPARAGQVRHIE